MTAAREAVNRYSCLYWSVIVIYTTIVTICTIILSQNTSSSKISCTQQCFSAILNTISLCLSINACLKERYYNRIAHYPEKAHDNIIQNKVKAILYVGLLGIVTLISILLCFYSLPNAKLKYAETVFAVAFQFTFLVVCCTMVK